MKREPEFRWVPQSYVLEPQPLVNYVSVYRNYWWAANEKGEVAIYIDRTGGEHPQCNMNRTIVETLAAAIDGYVEPVFIPLAYTTLRMSDYDH